MIATVQSIAFNQSKVAKSGKEFKGAAVTFQGEKGQKKEFIMDFSPFYGEVAKLSVGDQVDVKYTKNGDFFNVSGVTIITKGNGTAAPTAAAPAASGASSKSYGSFSPEKELAITRMSCLKTATDLITAALSKDLYKKSVTVEFMQSEVFRVAQQYEKYITGELALETLLAPEPVKAKKAKVLDDEEVPFDSEDGE